VSNGRNPFLRTEAVLELAFASCWMLTSHRLPYFPFCGADSATTAALCRGCALWSCGRKTQAAPACSTYADRCSSLLPRVLQLTALSLFASQASPHVKFWLGAAVPLWFFVNLAIIALIERVVWWRGHRSTNAPFDWKPFSRSALSLCLTAYMP
jgi:hypothetical protein